MKYTQVNTCPIKIYGASTGRAPIQVRSKKVATNNQNKICLNKLNCVDFNTIFMCGKMSKIKIDITKAITPPSLLGIDRRIA